MMYSRKIFGAVLILALASLVVVLPSDMARPTNQSDLRSASGVPVANQAQQESPSTEFFASAPVTPSVTFAAADLPTAAPEYWLDREINPRLSYNAVVDPNFNPAGGPDPLLVDQELAPRVYLPLINRFVAPTTGTVAGAVANASTSQPLSGAEVCVLSSSQCATTNAQGAYSISSVAVGSQTVRATAADFEASQQSATVPAGGTVTVDFALTPISLPEWTNIATEDFEGSFPQAGWHVEDNEPGYGKYYWAKRTCRPKSGSYSGWAVGGGADGSGLALSLIHI